MLVAAVPFILSWLLREVPLRTTLAPSPEPPAAAPAGETAPSRPLRSGLETGS
jgi:hypothetical protein